MKPTPRTRTDAVATVRDVVIAGYNADPQASRDAFESDGERLRELALGALGRSGSLDEAVLDRAFNDPAPRVRRRAVELAAVRASPPLVPMLTDVDPSVVEAAAWALGERRPVEPNAVTRLIEVVSANPDPLCRESAAGALGAIGDPAAVPALVAATRADRPAVRRRAVIALAPFDGDEVTAALSAALTDRDRQVRQAAEDLLDLRR